MADVTGALHHTFGGKEYTLRLTWGVLAEIQAAHGDDFLDRLSNQDGKTPPFALMIDIAAKALAKGEKMPAIEASDLADDMLTADPELIGRLMVAALPDASGNAVGAGKRKR
ncbi:hypothetical protein [Paenirhodobacter populi]|uniref:Gene transfer agent family protein n=1 Tax=Paenirhodobacter populi TaxID=2306993 RepID=A0A443JE04_9RHOB|nr:hypothetical protein [Sinirhodobacter populi]RWR18799.1 hypothetical protein D2T30_15675 [Sinirhodobacter populi]